MRRGPEILNVRNAALDDVLLARIADVLRAGELVALPTDTVYGVAADPRVATAGARLCAAKGRAPDKPIPLLADSAETVRRRGADLSPMEEALAARFWPGPLTLVVACGGAATEGYRVPAHAVARAVLQASDGLLRVTSANRSGAPPALTARDAAHALGAHAALVLDAGPSPGGTPSTVARVVNGTVEILRPGALTLDQLEAVAAQDRGAEQHHG